MGLRFRRSVRLFPGVRLNFSRGGVSTTVGVRGAERDRLSLALDMGFASKASFNRAFKARFDISPTVPAAGLISCLFPDERGNEASRAMMRRMG